MATKNIQTTITATVYPQAMSCSAGSSTYTNATLPLSSIEGTIVSVDAIELRPVRTSGSGAVDTFSGYTYPYRAGSSTEKYATNFTAATIKSWIEQYGFVDMAVHLGFKAESGSGYGTFYGNIYLSITITVAVEGGTEVIYFATSNDTLVQNTAEVFYYTDGGFIEPELYYYKNGTFNKI